MKRKSSTAPRLCLFPRGLLPSLSVDNAAGIVAEQAADELRSAACGEGEAKVLSERIMLQASERAHVAQHCSAVQQSPPCFLARARDLARSRSQLITALPSAVPYKWVVSVVLSRQGQGRVAAAQSLFCAKDDGDGSVSIVWQSDSVHAIVRKAGGARAAHAHFRARRARTRAVVYAQRGRRHWVGEFRTRATAGYGDRARRGHRGGCGGVKGKRSRFKSGNSGREAEGQRDSCSGGVRGRSARVSFFAVVTA